MTPAPLSARGLVCGYRGKPILRDVELDAVPGTLTVLIGPNGSGKTTLIRTLAGLLEPLAGVVLASGRPLSSLNARGRALRRSFIPQMEGPVPGYTVYQTAMAGRFARLGWLAPESAEDRRAVAAALNAVGLEGDSERPASELSGGEFRRLLIARALAQETPVLLADEPEAHLDARYQAEILEILRARARGGAAVVAALHDLNLASLWADRVSLLSDGVFRAPGSPEEVLTGAAIEGAYRAGLSRTMHPAAGKPQFFPRPPVGRPGEK